MFFYSLAPPIVTPLLTVIVHKMSIAPVLLYFACLLQLPRIAGMDIAARMAIAKKVTASGAKPGTHNARPIQ